MENIVTRKSIFRLISGVTFIGMLSLTAAYGQVQISTTPTKCNKSIGAATVTGVTHGKPPFQYKWSTGSVSATITSLPAGYYSVVVTDARGCTGGAQAEVEDDGGVTVSLSSGGGTVPYCIQDGPPTITITATASGGTPPYTYKPSKSITVSGSGSYSICAKDTNGCFGCGKVIFSFTPIRCSRDPNEISGPEGYGDARFVSSLGHLPYIIDFENDPDFATAPAQRVTVTHKFDSHMNRSTLRLGEFGFANMVFSVPPNSSSFSSRLDLTDTLGIYLDVTAGIDVGNNAAFWIFQTIDPSTGLPPEDPMMGFLPVNDSTHAGEGYVSFMVRPKATTITGDSLKADASIVFDINPAINTNTWLNIADAVAPQSQVNTLLPSFDTTSIGISFTSNDDQGGSGVKLIELYASEDYGPFQKYGETSPDSILIFNGLPCKHYSFFSIAKDNTGNTENIKENAEAVTTLKPAPVFLSVSNDTTVPALADLSLSVTTQGASAYQWEASENGGITFMILTDDPPFSGVNTNQLNISQIPLYMNGYQFRCKADNGVCYSYSRPVNVLIVSSLSGKVFYDNTLSSPITNHYVFIDELGGSSRDSVMTNLTGNYIFTDIDPGNYIVSVPVSKPWGGVNATDALEILRHFANLDTLKNLRQIAADVNANGNINSMDALLVALRFVGDISSFASGDWYSESDTLTIDDGSVVKHLAAICFGDVNASYIPELKTKPGLSILHEGLLKVAPGDEFSLPLILRKDITAGAISLKLNYPGDLFHILGVSMINPAFEDNLVYKAEKGQLNIAWFHLGGISLEQGDPLLVLKIRTTDRPLLGVLDFTVEGMSEVSDPEGKVFENLIVSPPHLFSDQSAQPMALGQNYPNPFRGNTDITYYLSEPGKVTLRVFTPLGKLLKVLVEEQQPAGYHKIEFSGEGLAAGVYPVQLQVQAEDVNFSEYKMMTKIH